MGGNWRLQTPSLHSWTSCSQDWSVRSKPSLRFQPSSRPSHVWVSEAGVEQLVGFCNPAAWGLKSAWPLTTSVTCRKPATLPRPQLAQLAVPNSHPGLPALLWWWDAVAYIRAGCVRSIPLVTPDPAHVGLRCLYGCGRWGVCRRQGGVFVTLQEALSIPIPSWLVAIAKADVQFFPIKRKSLLWSHCSCEITAFLCNRIRGSHFCNHKDCQLPAFSARGIVQAGTLEWVAISYSRRSSQPRDRTRVSSTGRCLLYNWATWEAWLQLVLASSSQPGSLTDLSVTLSPFRLWLLNRPQLSFCLKYHKSYTRFSYFSYIPTSSSLFPQTSCVKTDPLQHPT